MKFDYRQFIDEIAEEASRPAATLPHPSDFTWLTGDWSWHGQIVHFAVTAYGLSHSGEPFLIDHGESDTWILVLADPDAYGIFIGLGMRNGQARFTGDVTIADEPVRLRQTWRVHHERAIEIENERHSDGVWHLWDRALLEAVTPPN